MNDLTNPYLPGIDDDPALAPFAGRQAAFSQLHQYLKAPSSSVVLTLIGSARVGKTAFLRRFDFVFDETQVGVYIPLGQVHLSGEDDLIHALVRYTYGVLARWDITLSHLPVLPEQIGGLRDWLAEEWLPELWRVIRPHRRLVLLLDDAHVLLDALDAGRLPADIPAYLQGLMTRYPQLKIVTTLAAERETEIGTLAPLVRATDSLRLDWLSADETTWLLREPVRLFYALPDHSAREAYHATGGQPQLTQRCGYHLFRLWERDPAHTTLTPEDVKAVLPQVYAESEGELAALWEKSSDNERLVLAAMNTLFYADPLSSIDREIITSWLIETDYPLDSTAVNAALRSLEYREVVHIHPTGQITLTIGLLHRWLRENARLKAQRGRITPYSGGLSLSPRGLLYVALVALLAGLLLIFLLSSATVPEAVTPAPTATLVIGP